MSSPCIFMIVSFYVSGESPVLQLCSGDHSCNV